MTLSSTLIEVFHQIQFHFSVKMKLSRNFQKEKMDVYDTLVDLNFFTRFLIVGGTRQEVYDRPLCVI
jgi:hypothetical protein